MASLKIEAKVSNLGNVLGFIDEQLEMNDCPMKTAMTIDIAVEELFVNIASYAYGEEEGMAEIICEFSDNPKSVSITLIDSGIQYNPLERTDPDITLSAEEREIGGLGVYMVKKSMDDVIYSYENNNNILTIIKNL